jgi:cellulose synthase/poly-beta-1,6-N-acetylglucosamine synthase-like glycosyltransferase
MATWQIIVLSIYGVIVLAALVRHVVLSRAIRDMDFIIPATPSGHPTDPPTLPTVTVLIPAKDEAAVIERCLTSVLGQQGVSFDVIVADDRSTDGTTDIVQRLARSDSRLKLVRIEQLREGWTGKTNALHQAQQHARGEYLLFVDADTVLEPGCLAGALKRAMETQADLFSMLPALEGGSFWERVIQPFASACLMILFPLKRVNDPRFPREAFANGQFILMRRSAYDQLGGHESVRNKFVEDINLARQVRRAGLNLHVAMGPDVFRVRMYSSLAAIIKGWSRIFYSAVDAQVLGVMYVASFIIIFSVTGYVAVVGAGLVWLMGHGCPFTRVLFGMGLAHVLIQMTVFARVYRLTKSSLLFLPLRFLAVGIMLYILGKTARMCQTHHVEWRGTSYGKELASGDSPATMDESVRN